MDKRQEKTLEAIYLAFTKLVNEKNYDDITIQDILDESHIGRSTFYCHFKTKNDLLLKISNDIFEHVFSHSLQEEKTHDFSKDTFFNYRHLIEHIFYHVRDEKELFKGIMKSNGTKIFMIEFRKQLFKLVDSYYSNYPYNGKVPLDLKKSLAVENFIVILNYWIDNDLKESPEDVADHFMNSFIS